LLAGDVARLYAAHGSLQAERTLAGWRVYGPEQIARRHQIIALKSFGFSPSRIAELPSGVPSDLATFLELHEEVPRQEARRVEVALSTASEARLCIRGTNGNLPKRTHALPTGARNTTFITVRR
jgi:DNA-binding transcriptional MerR regulator